MVNLQEHTDLFTHKMVEILTSTFNTSIHEVTKANKLQNIPSEEQLYISLYVTGTQHGEYILALKKTVALQLLGMVDMQNNENDIETAGQVFMELLNIVTGITAPKLKEKNDELTITAPRFIYGKPFYPEVTSYSSRIYINKKDYIDCIFYIDEMMLDITNSYRDSLEKLGDSYQKLKQAHEQILTQQKMLVHAEKVISIGTLSAGVAHNINTPLGTINLSCSHIKSVLQKNPTKIDGALKSLGRIDQTVHRISSIVQALRSYSAQIGVEEVKSSNIPEIITTFNESFSKSDLPGNLDSPIEYEITNAQDISIICNDKEISRCLENLVTNAVEAMEINPNLDQRWVKIKAFCKQDQMIIEVINNGLPDPSVKLDQLFDPFYTTKSSDHPGLGLSLTQGIIEGHSGNIKIFTENDKTIVQLRLPLQASNTEPQIEKKTAA